MLLSDKWGGVNLEARFVFRMGQRVLPAANSACNLSMQSIKRRERENAAVEKQGFWNINTNT